MLRLLKIRKKFKDKLILDNYSLNIDKEESICLFGPNGCGKSTLLRILVGLDKEYEGDLIDEDGLLNNLSYVPQAHKASLLPWLTVRENILLPLRIKGFLTNECNNKLNELSDHTNLKFKYDRLASNLSGGEAQKVCLLRALISKPSFLVMDEPTSNLDYLAVNEFLEAISRIRKVWNLSIISVIHDPTQAERLGDRVVKFLN